MKTLIVLLFIPLSIFGQKIVPSSSIEFGYTDQYYRMAITTNPNYYLTYETPKNALYCDIQLQVTFFKYFAVKNNLETFFIYNGGASFNPFMSIYTINIFAKYKRIEIGYKHQCIHPVVSHGLDIYTVYSGAYDKIYVKVDLF